MAEPSLTKLMVFVQAEDAVPADEFRAYWRGEFFASIQQSTIFQDKLVRAVHNHILPGDVREDAPMNGPDWSGIGSYWFKGNPDGPIVMNESELANILAAHKQMIPMTTHLLCKEVL